MDQYSSHLPLKPGARALLDELVRRGEAAAVVTACIPELCRAALAHHGLTELFRGVYLAGQVGLEKTDPALYRHLSDLWALPPEECHLFDDSPCNCAAAQAAGWQVWCVDDPWQPPAPELPRLEGLGDYLSKL